MRLILAILLLAGSLLAQDPVKQSPAVLANPAKAGVGKKVESPDLAACLGSNKLLVVTFTGADCPISKLYRPKLGRLEKEYGGKGVAFVTVDDVKSPLVAALDARRTTEAFVVDGSFVLRYRGAIDDQYGIGYTKDAAGATYLTDALDALLAGKEPPVAATEAPGCAIERAAKPDAAPPAGAVTFHRDVEPIFQKRCAECHRPGQIGPFSLLSYDKAKSNSRRIREAVEKRRMPPWHADPKHGEWSNDRRLTDKEVQTVARWVDAGAPEGSAKDAPPGRKWTEGWAIGTPDFVVKLPKPERIPAEGTIPYRYINVASGLREDRWVQAMEVRPGNREVVHHILVFVIYPLTRLREQPPIDGGLVNGYFGIFVPGESPTYFPPGAGKLIPAGATIVFQIHYTATGSTAEDQSSIGFIWAKEPPQRPVVTRGIVNTQIRIPPGAADHREEAAFTFDSDARILSFLPHMHVRGKAFRYTLLPPEGKEEILLDVPAYDFNWQTCYRLKEPRSVKKGTRIRAFAVFDNSKGNPANPDPAKEVRFGQQTWEEMLIGYMDYLRE